MICVPCRNAQPTVMSDSEGRSICSNCRGLLRRPPHNWSPPKKNDKRAWKRIAKGEWLWDRRRVARSARLPFGNRHPEPDSVITRSYRIEWVELENWCFNDTVTVRREVPVPGTEREVANYRKKPEVDLGG